MDAVQVADRLHGADYVGRLTGHCGSHLGGPMAGTRTRSGPRHLPTGRGGADLTVTLSVGGRRWRYVAGLAAAGPDDRVFTLETDAGGVARVRFGDGVHGRRPPRGATVRVRYRTGAGAAGAEIVKWEGRWPPRRLALGVLLATCRATGR